MSKRFYVDENNYVRCEDASSPEVDGATIFFTTIVVGGLILAAYLEKEFGLVTTVFSIVFNLKTWMYVGITLVGAFLVYSAVSYVSEHYVITSDDVFWFFAYFAMASAALFAIVTMVFAILKVAHVI